MPSPGFFSYESHGFPVSFSPHLLMIISRHLLHTRSFDGLRFQLFAFLHMIYLSHIHLTSSLAHKVLEQSLSSPINVVCFQAPRYLLHLNHFTFIFIGSSCLRALRYNFLLYSFQYNTSQSSDLVNSSYIQQSQ